MAGGPSVYLADKMLDKTLKDVALTVPATFYVALLTTATETNLRGNDIANASEVANAGAYARVSVTQAQFSSASAGQSQVTVDLTFPTATAGWGTIYQAALMDASAHNTGNVWYFGPLSSSATIQSGDVLKIPAFTFNINL